MPDRQEVVFLFLLNLSQVYKIQFDYFKVERHAGQTGGGIHLSTQPVPGIQYTVKSFQS
jgi:hypothetical protein